MILGFKYILTTSIIVVLSISVLSLWYFTGGYTGTSLLFDSSMMESNQIEANIDKTPVNAESPSSNPPPSSSSTLVEASKASSSSPTQESNPSPVPAPSQLPLSSGEHVLVERGEPILDPYNFTDEQFRKLCDQNVRGKNNWVIITLTNAGTLELAQNWVESMKRTEYYEFIVFAVDNLTVETINKQLKGFTYGKALAVKIPDRWKEFSITAKEATWLTPEYLSLTHLKTILLLKMIKDFGHNTMFTDIDIVWLNKTIINTVEEQMGNSYLAISQEDSEYYFNSGFYFCKSNNWTQDLVAEIIVDQNNNPGGAGLDQWAWNRVLDKRNVKRDTTKIWPIPRTQAANGKDFFDDHLPAKTKTYPMSVHANYRIGSNHKAATLKGGGFWYI